MDGILAINGVWIKTTVGDERPFEGQGPLEGDILYSNGIVSIRNTKLQVLSASSHVSIVCHSGAMWSMEVIDMEILCPVGYKLRITNTSSYGVMPHGLMKSYKLDQLSYFCESCPRNKYSLDFGYLNYSLRFTADTYYTLLVDGQHPKPAYSGSYYYHDIVCKTCPYGGKCLQGISAVPNFWGYATPDGVRFQRCKQGYCCATSDCKGYNLCKAHRTGTLCGECEEGFSEAMFTTDCVPNDRCDPMVGWPVMASSALMYFIFPAFPEGHAGFDVLADLPGVRVRAANGTKEQRNRTRLDRRWKEREVIRCDRESFDDKKITRARRRSWTTCWARWTMAEGAGMLLIHHSMDQEMISSLESDAKKLRSDDDDDDDDECCGRRRRCFG